MKSKRFSKYHLFSCLGVLLASFYPLYMGVKVVIDMILDGRVMKENYPKYIIPYTPIAVALLVGVLLMPLFLKWFRRFAFLGGSALSTFIFFAVELLLERRVVVTDTEWKDVALQDWQMYMCYRPVDAVYKDRTPVDILLGNYSPAFKLHFYIISIVLVLSILNCLYGFARVVLADGKKRLKPLILQSISSAVFLGLCILACYTAFWRNGELAVSPLSATLMTVFFILFGNVGGIFAGSFLIGKHKILSVGVPALVSAMLTSLMYVGEMILLHGHLYILGNGFLFTGIAGIAFSPFDILVILMSGGFTASIFGLFLKNNRISIE